MKTYKVVFSPDALHDIHDACSWYNLQQKGLGKRLVTDIKKIVSIIKQNPFHASVKFDNIRTASCKAFPYAVHYKIDEINSKIRIVSIFHFSRKPYWI